MRRIAFCKKASKLFSRDTYRTNVSKNFPFNINYMSNHVFLVTGASSFVGTHLVKRLITFMDFTVIAMSYKLNTNVIYECTNYTFIETDYKDILFLSKI